MIKLLLLFILTTYSWAQVASPVTTPIAPNLPGAIPVPAAGAGVVQPPLSPLLGPMQPLPAVTSFNVVDFESLKIIKNKLPLEFELFFNHVYKYSENIRDKEYLVEIAFKLNYYLKNIPKGTRIILLKAEIVRNILEFRFSRFSSNLDINNFVIDKAMDKIKKFKNKYEESSLFVINSCIGDLAKFYDEEILNNLKLIKGKLAYKEAKKVQEIKTKTKYLRPWFYFFDKLSPGEFNDLVLDLAYEALKNIETKAFLQQYFAPSSTVDEKFFTLTENLPYQTSLFKILPIEESIPQGPAPLDQNTMNIINGLQAPGLAAPPTKALDQIEKNLTPAYQPKAQ
jgi:hypothetical protein